jgi:hypothetical protein
MSKPQSKPPSKPQPSSPIHIVEATTGPQLAQAAGLLLRSSRLGQPWRINASDRVLLAYDDGTPPTVPDGTPIAVAVAEVQPVQFGKLGIRRFRSPTNANNDNERLREHMTDFLRTAPSVSNPLTAIAA